MSDALIHPYLFFNGNCGEALDFYREALGAEVEMLMRYKDSPEPPPPGVVPTGFEDKVMHASFRIGGALLMASDDCTPQAASFSGFRISLTLPTETAAHAAFSALASGGTVEMPLSPTFWSPCFGMLTDRFGVGWMIGLDSQATG